MPSREERAGARTHTPPLEKGSRPTAGATLSVDVLTPGLGPAAVRGAVGSQVNGPSRSAAPRHNSIPASEFTEKTRHGM